MLPTDFQFSQHSLQDYVDCPRRFQLRYVLALAWPAVAIEPLEAFEQRQQIGQEFHRLVQRYLLGLPEELLTRSIQDEDLQRWWRAFLATQPVGAGTRYPEYTLSAALGAHRLTATCDLILVQAGQAIIFDWKTSQHRPKRATLAARLQTRVYRYLLVRAGASLNDGRPFPPEAVKMLYWFAEAPEQPEYFGYTADAYAEDEAYLTRLMQSAAEIGSELLPPTENLQLCRFCAYRAYCDRGKQAGRLDELEIDDEEALWDFALPELEQIAEIEF